MQPIHVRFLVVEQALLLAAINFLINLAIGWISFDTSDVVPLWGGKGVAVDVMIASFLLPLLVCLIMTPLVRKRIRAGDLPVLEWRRSDHLLLRVLPFKARKRAVVLGVCGVLFFGLPTVTVLASFGVESMTAGTFMWFKASYAAVLSLIVGPIVGVGAIARGNLPVDATPSES